jgi:peptide/nickel transport system substrate-binding protein
VHEEIAVSCAADLAAAGIETELVLAGLSDDFYRILQDPTNATAGLWDITAASWTPDWFGNNGRAYIQPVFQSSDFTPGTCNYGDYRNPEVDRLILAALSEQDPERAGELWHQVDREIIEDAAIVPIMACEPTISHMTGARVRNALPLPMADRWLDAANLWLSEPD